jgi:AraC-like DNA-binding protein
MVVLPRSKSYVETLCIKRPRDGTFPLNVSLPESFILTDAPPWQSNGGASRKHPARALPFSLDAELPRESGRLTRIHLLGVFSVFAGKEAEISGTLGANVQIADSQSISFRQDLVNGTHYFNAQDLNAVKRSNGDGSSLETVGTCEISGATYRVDLLTIDVPYETVGRVIRFRDLGSPASFVVFDVFAEFEPAKGCPFRAHSGGVALSELGAIMRLCDRMRFTRAFDQLEKSLLKTEDLDEARGLGLTFLAVVTAATLEMDGSREMHRVQLDSARALDQCSSTQEILDEIRKRIQRVAPLMFTEPTNPSAALMNRALAIVERNFAKPLSDALIAGELGLSTSHFRFLFRQATGQPFHKYLISVRLEKARQMLLEGHLPVSQVASRVGFAGLSHFSRAFAQRFSVSPTSVRRASA